MNKFFKSAILFGMLSLSLVACKKSGIQVGQDVIAMKGTEINSLVKLAIEETVPVSYPVSVVSTGKVTENVKVDVAIDFSLVEKYNKEHKTAFYALPDTDVKLDSAYCNIYAGKASSVVNNMTLTSLKNFEEGKTYLVPVTIKSAGDKTVLEAERTIYIKIAQTLKFSSLDVADANFSSSYKFEEALSMDNYTFEIKIYPYSWKGMTPNLSRLCAFSDENGKSALLYRFGEVKGEDILQVMTPGETLVSNTKYTLNQWTMLTVTYDGASVALYNDGVLDVNAPTGSGATVFQMVELGMSYQGYGATQLFSGRVAEIRVWNRALSSSEIKGGICGVAKDSEGLMAYWRFDEPSGAIFKNSAPTGSKFDMNWAKTRRQVSGDDYTENIDKSAFVKRVRDDKNKCAN